MTTAMSFVLLSYLYIYVHTYCFASLELLLKHRLSRDRFATPSLGPAVVSWLIF